MQMWLGCHMDRLRQLKALYRDIQENKNRVGDAQAAVEGDPANKQTRAQAGGQQQGASVRAGQQTRPTPPSQSMRNAGGGGGPQTRVAPPNAQTQQMQARRVNTEAVQSRGPVVTNVTMNLSRELRSKPKAEQQSKQWTIQQDGQEQGDELEQEAAAGNEGSVKTVLVDETGALEADGEERPNADEADMQYTAEGETGNLLFDFDALQMAREEEWISERLVTTVYRLNKHYKLELDPEVKW